jgi:hypothetical protein
MVAMRGMMSRLKLSVNEAKTRRCRISQEYFDFLGVQRLPVRTRELPWAKA